MANTKKTKTASSPKAKKPAAVRPEKQRRVKAATPKTAKRNPVKKIIIAAVLVVVAGGATIGGLFLAGVFKGGAPTHIQAVDFVSTLSDMKTEEAREVVSAYQEDDVLHLLYKSGTVRSTFVQLLTTPVQRSNLNSGGSVTFTKATVTSSSISEGVTRSVTLNHEATYGYKFTTEVSGTILAASVSIAAEHSFGYKFGYTQTEERSYVTEKSNSVTVEESHSTPLSECKPGYYYAFALYSDFDVFMDMGVKLSNGKLDIVSAQIYYGMYEGRNSIVFVESQTNDFSVPAAMELPKLPLVNSIGLDEIFYEGNGSSTNPYLIFSAPQLLYLGAMPDKHFKLMEDIILDKIKWRNDIEFSGVFDGNNKTLSGMKIEEAGGTLNEDRFYGLFRLLTGTVQNLKFMGCSVMRYWEEGQIDGTGKVRAGVLAGRGNNCTVRNVRVIKSTVKVNRENSNIGAILGELGGASGLLENCKAEGVIVEGYGNIGGICGGVFGKLAGCAVDSYMDDASGRAILSEIRYKCVSDRRNVGGMAGYVDGGELSGGSVINTKFVFTGGGWNDGGSHTHTYAPNIGVVVGLYKHSAKDFTESLLGMIQSLSIMSESDVRSMTADTMSTGSWTTNRFYTYLPTKDSDRFSSSIMIGYFEITA